MKLKLVYNLSDIQLTKLSCALALSLPGTVIIQHSTVAGRCQTWLTSLVALEATFGPEMSLAFLFLYHFVGNPHQNQTLLQKIQSICIWREDGDRKHVGAHKDQATSASLLGLPGSCPADFASEHSASSKRLPTATWKRILFLWVLPVEQIAPDSPGARLEIQMDLFSCISPVWPVVKFSRRAEC